VRGGGVGGYSGLASACSLMVWCGERKYLCSQSNALSVALSVTQRHYAVKRMQRRRSESAIGRKRSAHAVTKAQRSHGRNSGVGGER